MEGKRTLSASGFERFHVLTEKPSEMTPVRRVGGAIRYLDLNSPVVFDLGVRSEDAVDVSAPSIIMVDPKKLVTTTSGALVVATIIGRL